MLVPPALVALWRLDTDDAGRWAAHRRRARLAMLLLLPLLVAYLDVRAENPNLLSQSLWSTRTRGTVLPQDLVGFLSLTSIAPAAAVLLALGIGAALVVGPVHPRAWQTLVWIAVGTCCRSSDDHYGDLVSRIASTA